MQRKYKQILISFLIIWTGNIGMNLYSQTISFSTNGTTFCQNDQISAQVVLIQNGSINFFLNGTQYAFQYSLDNGLNYTTFQTVSISPAPNAGSSASYTVNVSLPTGITGELRIRIVSSSPSVTSANSAVIIVLNPNDIIANAGSNLGTCQSREIRLAANNPTAIPGSTGTWSIQSGSPNTNTMMQFQNINLYNSAFFPTNTGVYNLIWRINNSVCNITRRDTVTVNSVQLANAGPSLQTCPGVPINLNATSAMAPSSGGQWSVVAEPGLPTQFVFGQFLNSTSTTANESFSANVPFNYTLRWTINGGCANNFDTMRVLVPNTQFAEAGPNQSLCFNKTGFTSTTLAANAPSQGATGLWSVASAPVGASTNFTNSSVHNTTFIANKIGTYKLKWRLTYPSCPTSSLFTDSLLVILKDTLKETSTFGEQTVCRDSSIASLNVLATSPSAPINYQWYVTSSSINGGALTQVGTNSSTYTPSSITSGVYLYYVNITDGCAGHILKSDNATILVSAPPIVSATATPSTIVLGNSVAIVGSPSGGSWSIISGPSISTSQFNGPSTGFTPSLSGTYVLRYSVNTAYCGIIFDDVPIIVSSSPNISTFIIPNNASKLNFSLQGGNGGNAVYKHLVTLVDILNSDGGKGRRIEGSVNIGDCHNCLPYGTVIKTIEGQNGENYNSKGLPTDIFLFNGAGGGGGSAILYKVPNSPSFEILAVGGGGGGASLRMETNTSRVGLPGSVNENGNGGNNPGTDGNGGGGSPGVSGAGGGALTDGSGPLSGGAGGQNGGLGGSALGGRSGGFGYGGGGAGISLGGGGGGHSGGGSSNWSVFLTFFDKLAGGGGSKISNFVNSSSTSTGTQPTGYVTTSFEYNIPNAGPDLHLCGGDSIQLSANVPLSGQGFWSVINETGFGTGTFKNTNVPNTFFYPEYPQTHRHFKLHWTVGHLKDTMIVTWTSKPKIESTNEIVPCLSEFILPAKTNNQQWTILSGLQGQIVNQTSAPKLLGIKGQTYSMKLWEAWENCETSDTIHIRFSADKSYFLSFVNTSWHLPESWTDGYLPTECSNVVIQYGIASISNDSAVTVKSIDILSGNSLTLNSNSVLTVLTNDVNGVGIWNKGHINLNDDIEINIPFLNGPESKGLLNEGLIFGFSGTKIIRAPHAAKGLENIGLIDLKNASILKVLKSN